jgi:hypothetical protein
MKTFKRFANWIQNSRGVATSLIEATATVAVGAVLAGVAVGGAIDAINNSKIQAAIGDVNAIGQGVITFYKDNSFFPLFVDGQRTGAGDDFYGFLVSENGTYPTDATTGYKGSGVKWDIPLDPASWPASFTGFFGHQPNYTVAGHATLEGHLIANVLGAPGTTNRYPLRGSYLGDPNRGWAGPYITSLPRTDPWGDKYILNVRNLHPKYLQTYDGGSASALPKLAVIVISAGANRNIETPVDQPFDNFAAQGDDIVFRIK